MHDPSPRAAPRLSIVIDNYNYAQFVARAIDSALEQTVIDLIEVIVVDDGSTDGSVAVIAPYADRVRIITKPNGGQASAYNAGFAAAQGALVLFLDADDWLYPDAAAEVIAAWTPGTSKVQFLLDMVDGAGDPLYRQVPRELHDTEAPERMRDCGAYGSPPGSGNAYDRDYLRQVMPLDEATWRTGADSVPILLAPAYGRISSLPRALGAYRIHRPLDDEALIFNNYSGSLLSEYQRITAGKQAVADGLDRLGMPRAKPLGLAPWEARTVVMCARFGGAQARAAMQPSPGALVWRALVSVGRWPLITGKRKAQLALWMLGVTALPLPLAHRLAQMHRRSAGQPDHSAHAAAARLAAMKLQG
jgi:hypothetical protein